MIASFEFQPILADSDVPWYIVALIFIAFIRWIWEQITGAAKAPPEEELEEFQTIDTDPSLEPEEDLRRYYETLAQPVSRSPSKPPPPPKKKTLKIAQPELSAKEREALERIKKRQKTATPGKGSDGRKSANLGSLRSMLKNPKSIRQAVLLKEILDHPKGLQNDW